MGRWVNTRGGKVSRMFFKWRDNFADKEKSRSKSTKKRRARKKAAKKHRKTGKSR